MSNRQLVLAVFPDELAADSAAAALKDPASPTGTPSASWPSMPTASSSRTRWARDSTGKGAAIGGVIGVFTAAFLGPAVLVGGRRSARSTIRTWG